MAVSWCDPTANNVVCDAVPSLTVAGLPRSVVPSLNCTVPAAAAGVTVAICVTAVPWATGEAGDVVSAVLVAAGPGGEAATTTNVTAGDVDAPKATGSEGVNTAVSWRDPTANCDMVPDAVPFLTTAGEPRSVVPSLNCTAPAAVAGVTAAFSVTMVPWATGETGDAVSVVVVTAGAMELMIWRVPPGDAVLTVPAALAIPPMSNNTPRTAAAATKALAACHGKNLLIRMVGLHFR